MSWPLQAACRASCTCLHGSCCLAIVHALAWHRHWYGAEAQRLTISPDVQVSGNHRLDDNKAERQRLSELGRELSSSAVEGRPVGPLRVWPGGLAMSRTLGDNEVWASMKTSAVLEISATPVTGELSGCAPALHRSLSPVLHDRGNPQSAWSLRLAGHAVHMHLCNSLLTTQAAASEAASARFCILNCGTTAAMPKRPLSGYPACNRRGQQ